MQPAHFHCKWSSAAKVVASVRSGGGGGLHQTHLSTEKTRAIFPIARILFLITSFLTAGAPPEKTPSRGNEEASTAPPRLQQNLDQNRAVDQNRVLDQNRAMDHLLTSGTTT